MKLHEDKPTFKDAIELTAQELGIYPEFVEKDYWICQILQNLSRHLASEKTVWKGGTSLSKAYGLIARFSSDVDFAILGEGLSQNQQKKLVARIGHESTVGMEELVMADTVKNNRFRKTYHAYKSVLKQIGGRSSDIMSSRVIVEINTYGNPYPYEKREITPFITEMMTRHELHDI
ncbi:MAG: nucleotidyl transferase AbiEii/AbiGii toxin family protein, partial [Muribaculaceae bacterium]|nr:nucleotidyl transferase AbiEii/AbiGii toxin family protein [Muribaculaceae bacterium]